MQARRSHRPRAAAAAIAVGAVLSSLVAPIVLAPASAAAPAAPDFLGTLAGPSQAAMYPSGLEYDAVNDRLVMADTGRDRIRFYSLAGVSQGGFGTYGTEDGQFASPRDVAIDDVGNIYVADAENNRIQAFDTTGVFRWKKGGQGNGDENLNTPIGLTWDSQNDVLLVASTSQNKIKAWNADGVFQWQSPVLSPDLTGPRDVTRGPDGKLWVTSYDQHQIKVFDVGADGDWTGHLTPDWVLGSGNGSGVDQMNYPYNVVFSHDGDTVYIADTGNGRIVRYDISGAEPVWMTPFGGRCDNHPQPCEDPPTDAGKFNHLRRVAIDPAGNIYGADFWGAGVEVFDPAGNSIRSIEGDEPPAPGFAEAYAVDVAPDGQIYVMDRLNHRIQRFQPNGTYVNKVGARGTQAATFSWPEGLTVGPDGDVWAMDTRGGRIERFEGNLSATGVPSYGTTGGASGEFNYPSNADVDASGVVWVADTRNHRIQKYNPTTGTFSLIGSQGTAPGQFSRPMGISVTSDAIYVADTENNRVQKLALDGSPLASYSTGLNRPEGLEVAPDGSVWVADTFNNRLVHLSENLVNLGDGFGSLGAGDNQFFNPHDLAFGNDKMYVADTYNNRVQIFEMPETTEPPPAGDDSWTYSSQISAAGGRAPLYPAGIAIADDDTWFVADSAGSRLVTVDPGSGDITALTTPALNDPRDVVLDSTTAGRLWVLNTGANRVLKLSTTGSNQGGPITGLNQPYGLTQDADRVYVANTYANEVRAYTKSDTTTPAWTQTTCNSLAFSRPRDVGVASDGRILVADTDNDRIVLLNATTGACDSWFGDTGAAAGQFKSPRTVTGDGGTGLWVGDAFNYRIQHLGLDGTPLGATPVDAYGNGADQFISTHCVTAVPGTDDVAVCDTFNNRITVWDGSTTTPTRTDTIGGTRPAAGGFNGPFGVAYGPAGELYVADWFNHRIQKFNADGSFAWQRGNYGPKDGSLVFPRNVLVSAGKLYVTDSENNRIDVFTPDGDFLEKIKPTVTADALSRPHQIALDGSGGFWVADTNNNRVFHLGANGANLGEFPVNGDATNSRPQGIAVDTDGTLLVSNSGNDKVERYSTSGSLLGTVLDTTTTPSVDAPAGLQVTGTGADALTWVADFGNNRVIVLDADGDVVQILGSTGAGAGQLSQPRGVALDPTDGDVAIADFANDRVSVWTKSDAPAETCTTRTATYQASLGTGPAVLRYRMSGVELCTDQSQASVQNTGTAQASQVAPASVDKAMAKIGMKFSFVGSTAPTAATLAGGSARARVSGSWSSCVDLSYNSAVVKQGIKAARKTAKGPVKQRLGKWSAKKIATSRKIPTKVKHQIADRGIASVMKGAGFRTGRSTLQNLALDVVDQAFDKAGRNGLKQLVAGQCLANVWAPTISVTMTADGTTTNTVSGTVKGLRIN
ncbi:MAG: SMP-30/gluconolactonase/LRE family protein [Nocardioides sp.]